MLFLERACPGRTHKHYTRCQNFCNLSTSHWDWRAVLRSSLRSCHHIMLQLLLAGFRVTLQVCDTYEIRPALTVADGVHSRTY